MAGMRLSPLIFLAAVVGINYVTGAIWPDITCHPDYDERGGLKANNEFCLKDKEGSKCHKMCVLKKSGMLFYYPEKDPKWQLPEMQVGFFLMNNYRRKPNATHITMDDRSKMLSKNKECEYAVFNMETGECSAWTEIFKCVEEALVLQKC